MPLQSSLPTDSLYKFLTFGGLLLVLAGLFLVDREEERRADVNLDRSDRATLLREVDAVARARDTPAARQQEAAARAELQRELEAIRAGRATGQTVEVRLRPVPTGAAAADSLLARLDAVGGPAVAWWLIWIGAGVALFGFGAWYLRLQRHLDRLARAQADRAELEVAELRGRVTPSAPSAPPLPAGPPIPAAALPGAAPALAADSAAHPPPGTAR